MVTRFQFTLPEGQRFSGIDRRMIDISPDGTQLVYVASGRLYLRSMSEQDAKAIPRHRWLSGREKPRLLAGWSLGRFSRRLRSDTQEDCRHGWCGRHHLPSRAPVRHELGARRHRLRAAQAKASATSHPMAAHRKCSSTRRTVRCRRAHRCCRADSTVLFTLATGTALNRWDSAHVVVQSIATGERKTIVPRRPTRVTSRQVTSSTPSAAASSQSHSTRRVWR